MWGGKKLNNQGVSYSVVIAAVTKRGSHSVKMNTPPPPPPPLARWRQTCACDSTPSTPDVGINAFCGGNAEGRRGRDQRVHLPSAACTHHFVPVASLNARPARTGGDLLMSCHATSVTVSLSLKLHIDRPLSFGRGFSLVVFFY